MLRVQKLMQMVEEGLEPHRNIFRKMKKQNCYSGVPSSPASLPPSLPLPFCHPLRRRHQPLLSHLILTYSAWWQRMKIFMRICFHLMNSKSTAWCTVNKLIVVYMWVSSCENLMTVWQELYETFLCSCRHRVEYHVQLVLKWIAYPYIA